MASRNPRNPEWKGQLLPRTMVGISVLILFTALGAAFSGAVLYSFYEFRNDRRNSAIDQYANAFSDARKTISTERDKARREIQAELEPLRQVATGGKTLQALVKKTGPAVWFVRTLDEGGRASVGSAFAVASDGRETYLLTAFSTVQAASRRPGPDIFVSKGQEETRATLHTWEESKDLALLIVRKGDMPKLKWANASSVTLGQRIFVIAGRGTAGGAAVQGFIADVSRQAIQHDAPVGAIFRGAPVINSDGEVIGIASRTYAPFNFDPEAVFYAPPIRTACQRVLSCSGSEISGPAGRGAR